MARFVGRDAELAVLDASIRAAHGRRGVTAVVVEGEPGSGKSRLVEEALRRSSSTAHVAITAYAAEAALPFAPGWALVRAVAELAGEETALARLLDAAAVQEPGPWIALSEVGHRACSRFDDLVLVVDDAQWWDERSAALVHHLVRGAAAAGNPLAVVVAGRPAPATRSLAGSLRRLLGLGATTMSLGPLGEAAATALVLEVNPGLAAAAAGALARQAGGLPFWCELFARGEGAGRGTDAVLADRLAGTSAEASEVLTTLTVLGGPADGEELGHIHGWTTDRVAAVVAELEAAGVVARRDSDSWAAHDLVRDALARRVSPSASRRAHRRVASWFEATAGDDPARLLGAALHRRSAGDPYGPVLLRLLDSPGRRALGHAGLQTLVDLVDEMPSEAANPDLQRRLASLAGELGQHTLAMARWVLVAERLPDAGDRATAWLAACRAAQHLEDVEQARSCLARARAVGAADAILAIELDLAEAAIARWLERRADVARDRTQGALAAARALVAEVPGPDVPPRLRRAHLDALTLASLDAQQRGATDEMLPMTDELSNAAAGFDASAHVESLLRLGAALLLAGRLEEAGQRLGSAYREARRSMLPNLVLDAGSWLAWARSLSGHLADVEDVASECEELATRIGEHSRPAMIVQRTRWESEISRGDRTKALDALRTMAEEESDGHFRTGLHQALALWLARLEPERAAAEIAERARNGRADAEAAGCRRCRSELLLAGTEALARVGEAQEAAAWLEEAEPLVAPPSLQEWLVVRARAALACALRSPDARYQLEAAAEEADRRGLRREAIWVLLDVARLVGREDRRRAATLLDDARSRASSIGAETERQLAEQELRSLGVRTWRRTATGTTGKGLAALSEREIQVARLVAAGANNVEIARELFLSRKTIERHVSSILTKLGVRNRAELAAHVAAATAVLDAARSTATPP